VELSRPERRNALDTPMIESLCEALTAIAADPAVRCVVLSGAGSCF
jgi:2-(1,2-epoxy-1,2-dihydrophenyl)acetyl-CoA isomerase